VPVHAYTIKAGTRSKLVLVYATDGAGGAVTGLSANTAGAAAAYVRAGEPKATAVQLREGKVGEWGEGSFVEVDRVLLPGVYQFGAPDELLADGSTRAILSIRFPGAVIDPVEIELVRFDPQDPIRLGMTALGPEGRMKALRAAFPRIARKEIEERVAMKDSD
jgi:hypothetical protein